MTRPHRARYRGMVAAVCLAAVLVGCGSGGSTAASTTVAVSSPTQSAGPSSAASSAVGSSKASGVPASSGPGSSAVGSAPPPAPGRLIVFAAASLKATFTTLGTTFQNENPGSTIAFSFAGSSDLVAQIIAGAPADVFASADTANMAKVTGAGVVSGTPINFAANILTIVTPSGNPAGITSFADLAKPGVAVVVCAPQVPCGAAAQKIETTTGVTLAPVSEESSVTDVLNKVQTGEADAGLVYVTDAADAGNKVTTVNFPEATGVVNVYPIAALTASSQPALATKFIDLVTGPEGRRVLAAAGFQPAP